MADVVQKINNSNDIKNGYSVVGANKQGDFGEQSRGAINNVSLTGIENRLTDRFDDLDYAYQIIANP